MRNLGLLALATSYGLADFATFDDGRPRRRYPWVRETVEHYETPKPLTKRQKRRLRGKAKP